MPSTIQAHLMFAGHAAQIGDTLAFTEQWISHNLRDDLPSNEYLPDIGDIPLSANIIGTQSIVAANLQYLTCKTITEQEYIEGDVRGTIYTVQYDDSREDGLNTDPTQNENNVIVNISSAAQVDSYTKDSSDTSLQKLYVKEGATYKEAKNPTITKISSIINVSTTKRYRNKTLTEIIALGTKAGSTNTSTQWGIPAGCILYNGNSSAPIQEIVNSIVKVNWNVTHNYSIKYIPGSDYTNQPTWDHVWYNGYYTKLYSDAQGTAYKLLYPRDTLPNDLP